jgi:uncharacterized phage protein (TIGR01671 family)
MQIPRYMNREIKFRAWDRENNCWYKPLHEAYRGHLFELLVGFNGDLCAHTMNGMVHESMWPNKFNLMQYTGFKDENHKDVYEGDILETYITAPWDSEVPILVRGVVTFDDPYMGSVCFKSQSSDATDYLREIEEYRIIGNIYENPELLKTNI